MTFEYFDVHSHLYFSGFDQDREEEIEKMKKEKIATITIGTDFESSKKAIDLAEKHDNLFASVGFHPSDVTLEMQIYDISYISKLAEHKKVVAIGECGLDYYRMPAHPSESGAGGDPDNTKLKEVQKKIFQSHIDLSLEKNLPLMLHIRPQKGTMDAYLDALEILESQAKVSGDKLRGNVHFFVGDLDVMKRFLNIGFTMSFTGVLTFARDYDQQVRFAPLDMIMSETDAPFVAPVPYRGQRNSPLYVPEVVKKISEIRSESFEEVKKQLLDNALKHFPSIVA